MDFRHRVLACATTWRRPSPPAPSPIVDYLSFPGGVGDYAEATTSAASLLMSPGDGEGGAAPMPAWTYLVWFSRDGSSLAGIFECASDPGIEDDALRGYASNATDLGVSVYSEGQNDDAGIFVAGIDTSTWRLIAVRNTGTSVDIVVDGVQVGTAPCAFAMPRMIGLVLGFGEGSPSKQAQPSIWGSALSDAALFALAAQGRTYDITVTAGAWAGGTPAFIWRGAAVDGVVPNTGSGGACGLTLNGAVTSEVDP